MIPIEVKQFFSSFLVVFKNKLRKLCYTGLSYKYVFLCVCKLNKSMGCLFLLINNNNISSVCFFDLGSEEKLYVKKRLFCFCKSHTQTFSYLNKGKESILIKLL